MSPGLQVVTWVAGTLVAVLGAYFAYRQIQPRPALTIYRTATPLITKHEVVGVTDQLTIEHAGLGKLQTPTLVRVIVENSGRADVTSSHFDGGAPLRLDVGTPILEILLSVTNRPAQIVPPVAVDKTAFLVGPGLISRGQSIEYPCLVDGDVNLQVTHSLANVELGGRLDAGGSWMHQLRGLGVAISLGLNLLLIPILVVMLKEAGWPDSVGTAEGPGWTAVIVGVSLWSLMFVGVAGSRWYSDRKKRRQLSCLIEAGADGASDLRCANLDETRFDRLSHWSWRNPCFGRCYSCSN